MADDEKEPDASSGLVSSHQLFEPKMLMMPLDCDGLILSAGTKAWIEGRLAKGDPGPLYVGGGEIWTDMSEAEAAEAAAEAARARGVEVREATEEEQREALERAVEGYFGLEGVRLTVSEDGKSLEGRVSEQVVGSTLVLRTATAEAQRATTWTLVLSRSGRSVERLVGPRPAGWGYVVRSGGVALEVVVRNRDARLSWRSVVMLVHRRVEWPGDERAEENGIQQHCELVGGACASEGPGWQFYAKMEEQSAGWPDGPLEPGSLELARLWETMEEQLETWLS